MQEYCKYCGKKLQFTTEVNGVCNMCSSNRCMVGTSFITPSIQHDIPPIQYNTNELLLKHMADMNEKLSKILDILEKYIQG